MEHIIQIAVSVDDDRIAALAEQAAAKDIVRNFIDATGGYTRAWTQKLSMQVVEAIVSEMAADCYDEIAEEVVEAIVSEMAADCYDEIAEEVAARLTRSQKFREKVAAALAERGE